MGLPWHRDTQFNFVRRHQKATDCSNINELFHLGGRYYLSTQHGSINVYNTTNGSSHILRISPLIVYHFPCDLTFASQQTGLGTCPDRITFHLPLFSHKSFRYIPWTHNDDKTLRLHYSSLNLTPPLQFDNKTMTSLDHTFRILDGQLTTRLATLKDEISHLQKVQSTTLNDWLTYFTFGLVCIHSFVFIILYLSQNPFHRCQPLFCLDANAPPRNVRTRLQPTLTTMNYTNYNQPLHKIKIRCVLLVTSRFRYKNIHIFFLIVHADVYISRAAITYVCSLFKQFSLRHDSASIRQMNQPMLFFHLCLFFHL